MYIPKHFEVSDTGTMHGLIREFPLATLITTKADKINANHIPLFLSETPKPHGVLTGHVARSNPLIDEINDKIEALAIFHGPEAYISPAWYATKQETGKVVPTWNYAVVHVYGKLKIIDEPQWVRVQLENLTDFHEKNFSEPWAVDDAPKEFTENLLKSIIGIEITISKMIGKWKVSQNQPGRNRESVIEGLLRDNQIEAVKMAELVRNPLKVNPQ